MLTMEYIEIIVTALLAGGVFYLIRAVKSVNISQAKISAQMDLIANDVKHMNDNISKHSDRLNAHSDSLRYHERDIATLLEFKKNLQQ